MRRKVLLLVFFIAFAAVVTLRRPGGLADALPLADKSHYYPQFAIERFPVGRINCYVPHYEQTDLPMSRLYASLFHMNTVPAEDDEAYYYNGAEGKLTVYKHARQWHFEAADDDNAGTFSALTDEAVIEKAVTFMETRCLFFSYEETRLAWNGERYTVSFVDRIDNLKNYAFNNTVELDRWGRVLQADYYFMAYEKLNTCTIKSMEAAFDELPRHLPEDVYVRLTDCQLVYTYANSVIQPAYFFEGTQSGGQTVAYFVMAAVYGR